MKGKRGICCVLSALTLCFATGCSACTEERTSPDDYMYMYDVVHDWNKWATPTYERENLFGYGEYLYNSHLILFPREKPATIDEFYVFWQRGIDVDTYGFYFTCKLSEENFAAFQDGLDNFTVEMENRTFKPIKDEENFYYPTYILQWVVGEPKYDSREYIMMDEENYTVVFVYSFSGGYLEIGRHAEYVIQPKVENITDGHFSIYRNAREEEFHILSENNDFATAKYDISFLKYLD